MAHDLKSVYRAATEEEARREMAAFAERWNPKCLTIAALWQRNWERGIPFFLFPAEIRKVIYTTNAVESLNMSLRKALKSRAAFPGESSALNVMYPVLLRGPHPPWPRQRKTCRTEARREFSDGFPSRVDSAIRRC